MKKQFLYCSFIGLLAVCSAFADSETDLVINCAKRASRTAWLGTPDSEIAQLCAHVKSKKDIDAVINCSKRASSVAYLGVDGKGIALLCSEVKN